MPADDSPFISPPSPPLRPSLTPFRGDGSMRAGTQTLIQALQALPWIPSDDEEGPSDIQSEPESEEDRPGFKRLSSSIHAIYRPLARSRRLSHSMFAKDQRTTSPVAEEDATSEDASISEDEIEPDFDNTPRPTHVSPGHVRQLSQDDRLSLRPSSDRQGSSTTLKSQHRRERLADKLREIFELEGIHEVWAEMPCWLLRSVLLQGYMYLTDNYLCFFAHMPTREDQVLKSGSLSKRAQRTKRWVKHWFVLKNDALSWYQSSSDPYFPHGIVDLRYAVTCEPYGDKEFRLRTHQKTVNLSADSVPSRDEWVKAIKKVIFKAQNLGDTVRIAIPYSVILDVERSSAMDFSETIEVKVVDKEDQFSVDSYFFAYFHDLGAALEQIREAVRAHRSLPDQQIEHPLLDTTAVRNAMGAPLDRPTSHLSNETVAPKPSTSGFRLSSLLRPFSDTISLHRTVTVPVDSRTANQDDYTLVSQRGDSSFVPLTTSPRPMEHSTQPTSAKEFDFRSKPSTNSLPNTTEHTYPPSISTSSALDPNVPSLTRESTSSWSVGVPSWLKPSRRMFGAGSSAPSSLAEPSTDVVKEVYSSPSSASGSQSRFGNGDLAFSILETPNMPVDQETTEKFRAYFAYDERETLLGYFPGYIYRLLPVYGRLYVSTNYFCFKSTGALTSRTRMTLPIKDILSLEKSKATRFGHHGLIIMVKGHEELFFEFGAADKRDAFVRLLERQIDDVRARLALQDPSLPSPGTKAALTLESLEPSKGDESDEEDPVPPPENAADDLPAVMFTSASSTFLTFKPQKPLHFTFLTIGSRGDVQPYIALSKGLMADGHSCRIATHGEFKEWIEAQGIEFGFVGGDPAELMRICVENGMFTVSFLKETLQKFRGWLDDLLKTSWEACQGTDVLIESPSAMGGYHIAEALGIPYFRAFTMTWTRTRAYPHAFAVPERKMGGSYNYMSYVMFDQVFWRAISGQINRWRRDLLHLGPTSLDRMEPHKIPFLYNFSPTVVPPPLDWPEWIRVTGYWFLDDADVSAKKWTPPNSLVEFIDNAHKQGKKVVYIGFGSIVVSDPRTMTRCVIDAVVQSGVHAILSKGWSDRLHVKVGDASEPEEPLPPQIYPISSVPHDWLFKRIDAACHHGGAGTTGASLRAGIPTIIRPFFGDQFFWADRVEALGVGSGVRKLTVVTLKDALVKATTDLKTIDRAKLIGEQIRAENGVATAIESIYRDMEYARSLIKKAQVSDLESDGEDDGNAQRRVDQSITFSASGYSSSASGHGRAPSEDWSVISDQEDGGSSGRSRLDDGKNRQDKRRSFTAAVLSVLPDSLTPGSPQRPTSPPLPSH
ncbi:hypothetical protein NMY22_g1223 [Coprinellus aureogranulatus]|nr:hypothetical protein NMY22_g1223 [Coprinellus aureogranulatus]